MVLHALDYLLFSGLVIGSGIIGIYYGCCRKSKTVNEYILGDQTLIYPTIMSIIITFTSPKQMLADPTEVVMFGTQLGFSIIMGYVIGCVLNVVFFLPVLASLSGRSLLEYFQLRHNKSVRIIVAALLLIKQACMLPILIYLPSLVMEQMLGVPNFYSSVTLVALCLFYTTLGGMRAVIWTDTLQYGYYFITVVVCLIVGVYQVGGVSRVWQDNLDGDRIEFFNLEPRIFHGRTTFGSVVGNTMFALSVGLTSQSFYQRITGLKGKANPIKVVLWSYFGTTVSRVGGLLTGLVVYSYFKDCHPLLTKEIVKPDQIVAEFITKIDETIPGLLGLFSAGVVAASLSTMSSWLSAMACSVHDDFFLLVISRPLNRKMSFLIMQSVVFLVGLGALAATPLYTSVQSFTHLIVTTNAMMNGGILGMFVGSMINPWVTSKGLVSGAVAGVLVPIWMAVSSNRLVSQGKLIYYPKLLTTARCNDPRFGGNFTEILKVGFEGQGSKVFTDFTDWFTKLTAVSFNWYLPIGVVTTLVVSAVVSLCGGVRDISQVDPKLIVPQLRWILPSEVPRPRKQDEQESIPLEIETHWRLHVMEDMLEDRMDTIRYFLEIHKGRA